MNYKSTILIVDDEPVGRETMEALLLQQGYNLAFAGGGPEAISQATALIPDLILLDVMMPGMDGFQVCERLRADPVLAKVPIVMVTALDDRDSRLRGLEAGADDFISKPYDRLELRARVRTIVQLNRYRHLLSEQNKFKWVVEQADDGYMMVDNMDTIHYLNQQARTFLNLFDEQEPPFEDSFLQLVAADYHCEPRQAWENWPESLTDSTLRYLVRPETISTSPLWLQVDTMTMRENKDSSYLIRLRDVSQSMASQRLMWSFHGHISHKLKTPLSHVSTTLGYLQDSFDSLSKEDIQAMLEIAYAGAKRLNREIEDIFRYLNISVAGKKSESYCDLPHIVKTVQQFAQKHSLQIGLMGKAQLENSEQCLALSAHAITLIINEVLSNAQKFHPQQTPEIEVGFERLTEALRLQFFDNGLNLPPEQLAQIWMPYYQAEKYFSGQIVGMGLGLSIVASLIWEVGGDYRAYNRHNQAGLVIELTIPFVEEELVKSYAE